jgi:hypothetical protein
VWFYQLRYAVSIDAISRENFETCLYNNIYYREEMIKQEREEVIKFKDRQLNDKSKEALEHRRSWYIFHYLLNQSMFLNIAFKSSSWMCSATMGTGQQRSLQAIRLSGHAMCHMFAYE